MYEYVISSPLSHSLLIAHNLIRIISDEIMTVMTNVVKRRTYDASARQTQSAATRQRIVDAARALILERGYRATTIAAIATKAGVNTDSVYALVGRKPMVLRELIEQAVSGTDHSVAAEDRAYVKAIRAETDPARKLAIYARAVCDTHQRMAPLFSRCEMRRRRNRRRARSGVRSATAVRPTCGSWSQTFVMPVGFARVCRST